MYHTYLKSANNFAKNRSSRNFTSVFPKNPDPSRTAKASLSKLDKSNFNLRSTVFKSIIADFYSTILQGGAAKILSSIPWGRGSARKKLHFLYLLEQL